MQILAGVFNLSCIYVHVLRKYNPWDRRSREHARQNKIPERKNIEKLFPLITQAGFEPTYLR